MTHRYEILTKGGPVPARPTGGGEATHLRCDSIRGLVVDIHPDTEGVHWRRVEEPAPMGGRWDEQGDLRDGDSSAVLVWADTDDGDLIISYKALERDRDACIRILRGWARGKTAQQAHEDGGRDE